MCGINGFNWRDEALIKKMNASIKHRGPDDEGVFLDDEISLGHVRLSIIDLSEKGHQPMFYEHEKMKLWIVFNGEIYNFMELRKELESKGYSFRSSTDTEVVLAAYMEWGEKCVERFNGMWAFAIYDVDNGALFLSRDRFGIKPLYYYYDGERFVFSSEIKALFQHNIPRRPNDGVIFDYLYYNLIDHTEETFFEGIKRLLPGHNLKFIISSKRIEINEYYSINSKIRFATPDTKKFRELMLKAVERRLIADVPVGSCLSGGLDSSTIVCSMREINPESEIKVFSLVFPGQKIDESRYQEIISEHTKSRRYTTTFGFEELLHDLEDLIDTQEEPFPTLSIYGQYRVMRLAKENDMKVLLDGQGSDEILAGYHWFFGYLFAEKLLKMRFKDLIDEIRSYKKLHGNLMPVINMLLILLPVRVSKLLWTRRFRHLKKEFVKRYRNRDTKRIIWKTRTVRDVAVIAETYSSLPRLLRFEDKNAMRWSIESRVPFCDHEVVEYVLSLPSEARISRGITKKILREAFDGLVPSEVIWRKDKVAFATPDDDLLRTEIGKKVVEKIISSESFKSRPYWDHRKVEKMFRKHLESKGNYGREIWKMIILELWLRRWIDEK